MVIYRYIKKIVELLLPPIILYNIYDYVNIFQVNHLIYIYNYW